MDSELENLPKELLIEIALNMDTKDVLSLCNTSKKVYDSLNHNRFFWMEKLKRDYDVPYDPLINYDKQLYIDVEKYFYKMEVEDYYGIQNVLLDATINGNKDVIRIALNRGADILYRSNSLEEPLSSIPAVLLAAGSRGDLETWDFLTSFIGDELSVKARRYVAPVWGFISDENYTEWCSDPC